jgi:peptide/nickel transport system permease protein
MNGDTAPPRYERAPAGKTGLLLRVLQRPMGLVVVVFLLAVLVASLLAPLVSPYDPLVADFMDSLQGPSRKHPLGTDLLGRDVLSRMLHSGAAAFLNIAVALGVALVISVPIGILAGLLRGRFDAVVTRSADLVLSVPGILVFLIVLAVFQQNMMAAMAAFGFLSSPGQIRVIRSAAIAIGEEPYIAAARVSGLSKWQIAMRHILPRVIGPILVNMSLLAAQALGLNTGLNFLGLGVTPPAPSWGGSIADAANAMAQQPWLLVPTGGIVALVILALVLLGDALRDVFVESWSGGRESNGRNRSRVLSMAGTRAPQGAARADAPLSDGLMPLVRVEGLTIAFPSPERKDGWLPVVQGMSLEIGRHESIGLVGESGCGKTLTGLAILGLLPKGARILDGSIRIDGRETLSMAKKERSALRGSVVAFISQEPMVALDPLFSVGNQLREAIRTHRPLSRRQADARALELLAQVQIEDPRRVARQYPHELSGGMAQRVSIAIALSGNPSVLLADEPTTALDVTVQAEIIDLLRTIQKETGMAILFISHDWGVVADMCSRVVVMYAGQGVEYGSLMDMLGQPLHPYTRGLLLANPRLAERGSALPTIPGTVPAPAQWPVGCHFHGRCPYAEPACASGPIGLGAFGDGRFSRCIRTESIRGEQRL